jgi:hypothetical protein
MTITPAPTQNLSLQRIFNAWWPLAASWLLMALELPAVSAVIARLDDPEINLAAYGGVVFPLALIIEAPIIMLLAASTTLSKDWNSYIKIRHFMMVTSAVLTLIHILIAFTPLYYVVVEGLIGAPPEIVEPARIGLMIMTPWTWSIAYRRFNQGVLIRFGHSRAVSLGTLTRLAGNWIVLAFGYLHGDIPGIVVGASAVTFGVVCEALYVSIVIRPVRANELRAAPLVDPPLTTPAFFSFYIPLALTSLLFLLVNPINSAAMSRMPAALESLAVWPVVAGLVFILRSQGIALNEVVVALLDEPRSYQALRTFSLLLAAGTSAAMLLIAASPLSSLWLERLSALSPELARIAHVGVWIAVPLPALNSLQSWFQGTILYSRRTPAITESVVVYLFTSAVILTVGANLGRMTGLFVGVAAFMLSMLAQTLWLWYRSSSTLQNLKGRDEQNLLIIPSKV